MIQVKGLKKETVWIEIDADELQRLMISYLKISSDSWVAKNDDGKWAVFYDGGVSHYNERQDRVLSDEDAEYYESVKKVLSYIRSKEKK